MRLFPLLLMNSLVWGLRAQTVCGETQHIYHPTPTTGIITTPNWPHPYPAPAYCTYNLTTSNSNVIHLVFNSFDLSPRNPHSLQCLDAHILIVVTDRQGRQHIGERFCGGDTFPRRFETMQPHVRLEFTSQTNDVRTGFKIEYQFISEASVRQPLSTYYDADRTYETQCGGRNELGALTGVITSPGYPLSFPRNVSCNWLIRVEPRQRIYIRVVHLNMADIKECELGSLYIVDGYRHESALEKRDEKKLEISEAKFCGNLQFYQEEGLRSYISQGNRLIVRFITGPRTPPTGSESQKVGFKLIWTAIESMVEDPLAESPVYTAPSPQQCSQFACHGGQLCVDQGQGICAARSQFCIHSSLVCNGIPNCAEGDYSDEQHCYSREIAFAGGAGVIAVVLIIIAAVVCERRRKTKQLTKAVRSERQSSNKNGGSMRDHTPRRPNR